MKALTAVSWIYLVLWSAVCFAETNGPKTFYAGLGQTYQNVLKASSSSDGSKGLIGNIFFETPLALRFGEASWYGRFFWNGPLSALVGKSDSDGGVTKKLYLVSMSLERWFKDFSLRVGPGVMSLSQEGDGSDILLNNGNSFSTFYSPDGTTTTRTFYMNLGGGYALRELQFDLDAIINQPFGSRRNVSLNLSVTYGF